MDAIVSLLDAQHEAKVEALWAELEAQFNIRGIYVTPVPHFSYQVAESYDRTLVQEILSDFVTQFGPFRIRTGGGLGIFTKAEPVLYVPVVRDATLTALHQALLPALIPAANKAAPFYQPPAWMPKITIFHGDLNQNCLGEIVSAFCARPFQWEIEIDNIAIICDMCGVQGVLNRFDL